MIGIIIMIIKWNMECDFMYTWSCKVHGKTPESEWLLKLEWNGMERNEIGMDARRAK